MILVIIYILFCSMPPVSFALFKACTYVGVFWLYLYNSVVYNCDLTIIIIIVILHIYTELLYH